MSLTDPRLVVRQYFDPDSVNHAVTSANLTRENGSLAVYSSVYAMSERLLTSYFLTYTLDILFVVDRRGVTPVSTASGIIAYRHELYVQPVIIDKWRDNELQSVSATKLMDLANQEVRRVIRANIAGSFRLSDQEETSVTRIGSALLYGDEITVYYMQFVTTSGTYNVPIRRFTNYVAEWRVGTTAAVYASVGPSSGLGFLFNEDDPWVKLTIPTGSTSVYQLIKNFDITGVIAVNDYEAATVLLYETDVDNGTGGNQYAVSATGRTVIDYMALVNYHTKIINATDVRSSPTSTFTFTKTKIRHIQKPFEKVADPWLIYFYADSVTQTDSA